MCVLINSGHLALRTFSHILSEKRTQGIPLILETPAHDTDKPLKSKGAKSSQKKAKGKGKADSDEEDLDDDDEDRPKGKRRNKEDSWEIWKKEVEILGRIADLSIAPLSPSRRLEDNQVNGKAPQEGKEKLLEEWTEELRSVVVRLGGKDALTLLVTKENPAGKAGAKGTRARKVKVTDVKVASGTSKEASVMRGEDRSGSELTSLGESSGE